MSGETEGNVSGWTVDTLKALVDERSSWQERLRVAEKESLDKALSLADAENKYRLGELNNLRRDYTNDRGGFITIIQFDALKAQLDERHTLVVGGIARLEAALERSTGSRAGLSQGLGWVAAAVAVVLGIVGFVIANWKG